MPNFEELLRSELAQELNTVKFDETLKRRITKSLSPRPRKFTVKNMMATLLTSGIIAGGGLAYATGNHEGALDFIGDVFNGAPAHTEIVNKAGRPINATASDNGITIEAESIIGDGVNYTVIYSISKDDGSAFADLPATNNDYLPLGFEHWDTRISGTDGTAGGAYFYDANPNDPAIQLVEQFSVGSDTELFGKTARATFKDLGAYDGEFSPIAKGTWKLKYEFAYDDASRTIAKDGSFTLPAGTANLDSVKISPIAISVKYSVNKAMPENSPAAFREVGDITVTMRDGHAFVLNSSASHLENKDERTHGMLNAFLPEIIDPEEVESVQMGGTVFPAPRS